MTSKLLPCPFCGGTDVHIRELGIVHIERFAQCYTCELSVPLDAWNRRATQPAAGDPIQVEAVAVTREDEDGLYLDWVLEGGISALEAPGVVLLVAHGEVTNNQGSGEVYLAPPAAAPVAAGEPVYQLRNTVIKGQWREADRVAYDNAAGLSAYERRILWTAPPAAAHGDEAVRKDAERYRWLRDKAMLGTRHDPAVLKDGPSDCCDFFFGEELDEAIDATMRAQAGEGGK